jgi:von Willebrand factor type A domain/Aerotolerance regulator N-terminal
MLDLFRNTITAWQWVLLALVPPAIIALYFLKLKRQPLEVPSTYLWKRSLEDLHVNSLWQRLRQNLLLFLQLLIIALAMLALLRPGWEGAKLEGDRFIFLVDNSASMSATDAGDAKNRLEEAKKLVSGLIDQMESGMAAMIVSFADTPQVVQEFTDNRRLLRERLATIQPSVRGTDLRGALELADGLANPTRALPAAGQAELDVLAARPATVYIFSDGRFDGVDGFSLGNLKPQYVPIGSFAAENFAITAFTTRRSESDPGVRQAFVQVANLSDAAKRIVVEVQLDGQFLDAQQAEVPPGESRGLVFPLADAPAGKLTARLKYDIDTPTNRDALRHDDIAYAALNDAKPGRVLVVSPSNVAIEVALATERARRLAVVEFTSPAALNSDSYKRDAETGSYDLVIYDQCAPPAMPRANTLFVGRLPPGPAWRGESTGAVDQTNETAEPQVVDDGVVAALPQIIDWERAHPLLASVELGNVDIADSLALDPPPGAAVLIDSIAGPIAAVAPRDAYQDVVLGFEIVGRAGDGSQAVNTNWPRRLSFPTFWLNVLEYLAGGSEDSLFAPAPPGRPVELRPASNLAELSVIDPAGKHHVVRRTSSNVFQFHDTQQLGVYEVRQQDQLITRFAVNLFDRQESDVRLRPSPDAAAEAARAADIRIGHVDVAAASRRAPARREIWKALLACALFVLLFEWYIYNRRVYL